MDFRTVRRQFNYLCCFRSNIKSLSDEAIILDDETRDLQERVGEATNNAQIIFSKVETWLRNSDEMKDGVIGILDEAPNVESGCLKLRERYSLSKKAKETTPAIKELVEKCKFVEISHPPPPAASAPAQSGKATYEFESRRLIEEEIMKTLGNKVYKIGICGMGGLGKTTMAQKIMNGALKEGLFEEVVMAVVSQPVDKLNIQNQIAAQLGFEFKDDILISRANILRGRLRGNKRILLVLDDVWESLDMEELGIHCEDGCKVLLTSRNAGVLRAMNVAKVYDLGLLDEKEAWVMFRGNVGTCVDDAALNSVAKDVMRECKGLPMALKAVGIALKDDNDITIWEDALGQLRRSNPSDIPGVIENVYNPLKLSYDRLGNQNAKSMFLLCCLFPEDCDIPLKRLTYFAIGLHLFQDIQELKEVRGRTSTLIKILKTRGLLLDGSDEVHVRMHDVARDVSIFIASKERRVKGSDCTWFSSHVGGGARLVPPLESYFPKLKLLFMNNKVEEEMEIGDDLIGGSTELNVLFIDHGLLKSLPKLCTSVVTLVLHNCDSLESIAVVGQLKSLEILICNSCNSIEEFSEQVRGLKRLKLLQISHCANIERLAAGVISSLVALEELKIVGSFDNWTGGEIEEGKEASLREIEYLKKLRCLNIQVSDIALVAQPLRLSSKSSKSVQFRVHFGEVLFHVDLPKESYQRRMSLNFGYGNDIHLGDLSKNIFLTYTECLYAFGVDRDFNLNLATAESTRWLSLEGFENKKNISSAAATFPLLEFLSLVGLSNLEEIWDDAPIPSNSFTNLKHLKLEKMWALKRMGKITLSTTTDFVLQLESIDIDDCEEMEHLVLVPNEEPEKEDDIKILIFPKLKRLYLNKLTKLRSMICSRGIESIQFPLLAEMLIGGCRNLKWISDDHDDDDSLHLFCHPKVSFPNLKILKMEGMESKNVWCDKVPIVFFTGLVELTIAYYIKIRRLFPSSKIPQNLLNLQKLQITGCKEMVKVIEDDKEEVSSSSSCDHTTKHTTIFPSLKHLELWGLPKLESFCEWRCADLELPSLMKLKIDKCYEMKSFNAAAGSLIITPALQTVTITGVNLESVDDLNTALHRHFEKEKGTKSTFLQL